jgi:hypothetical protein
MRNDPTNSGQEAAVGSQSDVTCPTTIDGTPVDSADEAQEASQEMTEAHRTWIKEEREKWLAAPQGKLCLEFYRKFQEYRAYLEKHPGTGPFTLAVGADFHEHDAFKYVLGLVSEHEHERAERDRRNLRRAHLTARCRHYHADGRRCGSPRLRGKKLCYWHQRMEEARALKLDLGPMEDPDSIQMAIMKLQRAVIDGSLDFKQTGQLAYTIQLAAWNVTRTKMAREAREEEAE